MRLDVKFSEKDMTFAVQVSEGNESFNADMGEIHILHDGQNGATFTPSVSEDGVISWTNDRDLDNPQPVNIRGTDGKDGKDGVDGYIPVKGIDYFDGVDGKDGKDGKDGYTPVKGVDYFDGKKGDQGERGLPGEAGTPCTHRWSGTTLYVTSASGTSSANLKGDTGATGTAGQPGADGFSPTVAVSDITGGHRVSVTDKNGTKTFDVMDGKDGEGGTGGIVHWDDVEGKPVVMVGGGDTLTWDGNTDGLTEVIGFADESMKWYKVSDDVFTDAEIRAMSFVFCGQTIPIGDSFFEYSFTDDCVSDVGAPFIAFVRKPNAAAFFGTYLEQTFPEVGVYFFRADEEQMVTSLTFPGYTDFNAQEKIDPSYLYPADWNANEGEPGYVLNRTHYEEKVSVTQPMRLSWDGSTEGRESVDAFFHVSPFVLVDEDIQKLTVTVLHSDGREVQISFADSWGNMEYMEWINEDWVVGPNEPWAIFIRKENCYIEWMGLTFPKVGIYLLNQGGHVKSITSDEPVELIAGSTVHPLSKKYLPMDEITEAVLAALPTETWTFTMEDGTEITKKVVIA